MKVYFLSSQWFVKNFSEIIFLFVDNCPFRNSCITFVYEPVNGPENNVKLVY